MTLFPKISVMITLRFGDSFFPHIWVVVQWQEWNKYEEECAFSNCDVSYNKWRKNVVGVGSERVRKNNWEWSKRIGTRDLMENILNFHICWQIVRPCHLEIFHRHFGVAITKVRQFPCHITENSIANTNMRVSTPGTRITSSTQQQHITIGWYLLLHTTPNIRLIVVYPLILKNICS